MVRSSMAYPGTGQGSVTACLSISKRFVAFGCESGALRLWDVDGRSASHLIRDAHASPITALCSMGKNRFASGCAQGKIVVWEKGATSSAKPRANILSAEKGPAITSLAYAASESLISVGADRRGIIWDPTARSIRFDLGKISDSGKSTVDVCSWCGHSAWPSFSILAANRWGRLVVLVPTSVAAKLIGELLPSAVPTISKVEGASSTCVKISEVFDVEKFAEVRMLPRKSYASRPSFAIQGMRIFLLLGPKQVPSFYRTSR